MPLPGLDQPMAAQVVAVAMVADRWWRRGEYAAHSGIRNPTATRHSWGREVTAPVITYFSCH